VELGLLFLVVIHAMVGLRRIVLDLEVLKRKGSRYLTWSLVAAGAAVCLWGVVIFNRLAAGT
jgi:succinate dehydrogenase/fumarate reductase cytochrome b subunit